MSAERGFAAFEVRTLVRSLLTPRIWIRVALVATLVISAADTDTGLAAWLELRGELNAADHRIEAQARANDGLRQQIAGLEGDGAAIERAIREDLALVRPGETLVRFQAAPSHR